MSNYDKFIQALINASLESWQDAQVGSLPLAPGVWAALFKFKATKGDPDPLWAEVLGTHGYAGAILFCDSQGFYSCERYQDSEVLAKRWKAVVKDLTIEDDE